MDFRADFVEDKAKFRRLAVAGQEILTHEVFGHLPKVGARTRRLWASDETQSSAKSAEKTRADSYVDMFLYSVHDNLPPKNK